MSELFFDGYSEYELEAHGIPSEGRTKCLKQLMEYRRCFIRAGPYSYILTNPCEDEQARFQRCHQTSIDYTSTSTIGNMRRNNPALFQELNVSPTYEANFTVPTPLNFHR